MIVVLSQKRSCLKSQKYKCKCRVKASISRHKTVAQLDALIVPLHQLQQIVKSGQFHVFSEAFKCLKKGANFFQIVKLCIHLHAFKNVVTLRKSRIKPQYLEDSIVGIQTLNFVTKLIVQLSTFYIISKERIVSLQVQFIIILAPTQNDILAIPMSSSIQFYIGTACIVKGLCVFLKI